MTSYLTTESEQKTHPYGLHILPFKTSVKRGLTDSISVLQLNYNIPQNPPRVCQVVDELVSIDTDIYLGKAYIKEDEKVRLVAYFKLKKSN